MCGYKWKVQIHIPEHRTQNLQQGLVGPAGLQQAPPTQPRESGDVEQKAGWGCALVSGPRHTEQAGCQPETRANSTFVWGKGVWLPSKRIPLLLLHSITRRQK